MSFFGWHLLDKINDKFKSGDSRYARERELLMCLHGHRSLNNLARSVKKIYSHSAVCVQSIWVDGTPQAKFKTSAGIDFNCELADLLLIVQYQNGSGQITDERGIALQVKISDKYNALPGGKSTKLERALLEDMDRSKNLELYAATSCTDSSLIGSYNFGTASITKGLKDVARYTNFPKNRKWPEKGVAPLQVGWPKSYTSKFLHKPIGFVEAIQKLADGRIGRRITPAKEGDPWSHMIRDLRGRYLSKQMSGYGGQKRINTSSMTVFHDDLLTFDKSPRHGFGLFVRSSKYTELKYVFADELSYNVFNSINRRNENPGSAVEQFDPAIPMIIITFAEKNPLTNQNPES